MFFKCGGVLELFNTAYFVAYFGYLVQWYHFTF